MPPLPLLRFPGVVLFEIFKSLSIGEKIKLSICSKKISTQIHNARLYSQKTIVDLDILNRNIRVLFENNEVAFEIFNYPDAGISHDSNAQHFSIACCTVTVASIPTGFTIFWKNHHEGFLSAVRHLLMIFRCKFFTNIYYYSSHIYRPVFSELLDLQLEFKKITFYHIGSKDQNLLWNQIARYLGMVEDLRILSVANPGFIPVFTSWPQEIYISSSAWFTLESLLACTCTTIELGWSRLKNKDLDVTLKNWKTGGFPNLKYLKIHSLEITNNGTTILGMSLLELRGKDIQTDDGTKKATIKTGYGRIELSVTPVE